MRKIIFTYFIYIYIHTHGILLLLCMCVYIFFFHLCLYYKKKRKRKDGLQRITDWNTGDQDENITIEKSCRRGRKAEHWSQGNPFLVKARPKSDLTLRMKSY